MPRGRSTFTKRQKEQTRQQKQREKAERKSQRKQDKPEGGTDEMGDLHQLAAEQAALFLVGSERPASPGSSARDDDRERSGGS